MYCKNRSVYLIYFVDFAKLSKTNIMNIPKNVYKINSSVI